MGQASAIVINDGAATPVATTFSPESVTPSLAVFSDRTPGTAVGFRRLKVGNTFAGSGSSVNRAKFQVEYPVTSTVNGVTSLQYTLRANLDVILPDQSTDAERKNLIAFLRNGLSNALVLGAVRDLDPLY